ncbi:unnamed protein product [Orchesella dallaii]|uniref:Uncharacterized protein n=1 Tax=Orchesella dallaii TaxID=48710 RepID=A0ABP1QR86_9HEXA
MSGAGDYDTKEAAVVKKELEFLNPYLEKKLEYIIESGKEYELKDEVKNIKFYLHVVKDPYVVGTHGIPQVRNFISEIQEMSYRSPLPAGWKPKKKLKLENMGDDLPFLSTAHIGESYADKLRAKNRTFEEWKKTQDESSIKAFEERQLANEDEPWNITTPSAKSTSFENSARAPQESCNKPVATKGLPDWLKDPKPVRNTEDLNKFFERRQQPESERQEPQSNVPSGYNTDQEPHTWKKLGESQFRNENLGHDNNQGHWFFDSQPESAQKQPYPAQSQPFMAPAHPHPNFMQMPYQGASNSIYDPGQGVMYIPVRVPPQLHAHSVPYGVRPIYPGGPSPSFNQYLPPHVPRQMGPREFPNPHASNPRFSQPPSTSVRLPHQTQDDSYEDSFSPASSAPSATPSPSMYDPRLASNRIQRTNTYEDSQLPASRPPRGGGGSSPTTYNHRLPHNKFPTGNSRNWYNGRFKNDGRNVTSVNYVTGRKPPPLRRPPVRERMEANMGGYYALGKRKGQKESIDQPNAEIHDSERTEDSRKFSKTKNSHEKISPKKPEVTESHKKLVMGALKKKAAEKLLQDPEGVISFCQLLSGKRDDKKKSPQKETKTSQQQQGRLGRKVNTPTSESDRSDVASNSSSDVGSAKNRYPFRSVSSKKIQHDRLPNKSGRNRYFGQSNSDDRSETRSSSSSDAGSVRSNELVQRQNPEDKQKERKGTGKKKSTQEEVVVAPAKRGKQVARKKASPSVNKSPRVVDETCKNVQNNQNTVEKNNQSDKDETYDEVEHRNETVIKSLKTFATTDLTKEGRRLVHCNDIYTNTGLGKIKLEADYFQPVVEKRECAETLNEDDEFDQFLSLAYPEVSLKVEEGVQLQVQPDAVHDDNAFGDDNEKEDEFQPVVSEQVSLKVEEGVQLQIQSDAVHDDNALGDDYEKENEFQPAVSEQEITDTHHESMEESKNIRRVKEEVGNSGVEDELDMESEILIGNVISLKPNEVNETLVVGEGEQVPSETGTEAEQTSTPDEGEAFVKDSINTIGSKEQVLEEAEVSVKTTDGENIPPKSVSELEEEENEVNATTE